MLGFIKVLTDFITHFTKQRQRPNVNLIRVNPKNLRQISKLPNLMTKHCHGKTKKKCNRSMEPTSQIFIK